jgi:predicted ATPase with chaperone activity
VKQEVGLMNQKAFYHITTISNVALVGGGSYPAWRELYGAQRVLFLDEAPEFKEDVLSISQPLGRSSYSLSQVSSLTHHRSCLLLV